MAYVLVEGLGAVIAEVACLAVVDSGSVANEASVEALSALVVGEVSVVAARTDGNTGIVYKEQVDAVDSTAGGAVAAGSAAS